MTLNSSILNVKRVEFIYTFFFLLFLTPLYLAIGDEGLSANYSFILLPFYCLLVNKLKKPAPIFIFFIFFYFFIFLIAFIYQIEYYQFYNRRIISFTLFIIMFSYFFININQHMINSFKKSIVIISLFYSLITFIKFIFLGANEIGFAAKGEIGSQRFGFIYVIALWILFFNIKNNKLVNSLFIVVIMVGLILTFSRSGLVSLVFSGLIFLFYNFFNWIKNPNLNGFYKFFILIILFIILFLFLSIQFPLVFDFFNERLIQFFAGNSDEQLDLQNSNSSEGFRIHLIKNAIIFLLNNPLTGSGFLGIWVISEDLSGSAHNQYLDILFRTGIVGFLIYIYILYRIFKKLYNFDKSLFWGFIAVLFYGFVHETFKLSHGAFVLSFYLGIIKSKQIEQF
jgi:O-antigen ligase